VVIPPAPPLLIRENAPPRAPTPPPLIVREMPPKPPRAVARRVVTVAGKRIPPPPRKVITEKMPALPPKPQPLIVERWLPYTEQRRRVVYEKADDSGHNYAVEKPRNVVVHWNPPKVAVNRVYRDLGVVQANPSEYKAKYGGSLKNFNDLPDFAKEIKPPEGVVLAANESISTFQGYKLEGDLFALSLIDLDKEGLGEYKYFVQQQQQPQFQQQRQQKQQNIANECGKIVSTLTTREQVQEEPAKRADVDASSALREIISNFNFKASRQVNFKEAKRIIKQLDERCGRSYDEMKTKQVLDNMNLRKGETMDIDIFTNNVITYT